MKSPTIALFDITFLLENLFLALTTTNYYKNMLLFKAYLDPVKYLRGSVL